MQRWWGAKLRRMNIHNLIASLESAPIGDGDLLGHPFKCYPYQRRFLRGAFNPGVHDAQDPARSGVRARRVSPRRWHWTP